MKQKTLRKQTFNSSHANNLASPCLDIFSCTNLLMVWICFWPNYTFWSKKYLIERDLAFVCLCLRSYKHFDIWLTIVKKRTDFTVRNANTSKPHLPHPTPSHAKTHMQPHGCVYTLTIVKITLDMIRFFKHRNLEMYKLCQGHLSL